MRVEGVGRRVACRSRFCVTTFCADADRVSKQPPLMPKARDADKERVEKLFKDDGVTPYTLDLRAKYGDPLVLDESLVGDWTVIKIGSRYVTIVPVDSSGPSGGESVRLTFAAILAAYDLVPQNPTRAFRGRNAHAAHRDGPGWRL